VADDRIREGVRRIGEVVHEQLDLLGTLRGTGAGARAGSRASDPAPSAPDPALADVVHLPRRDHDARPGSSSSGG
jgi:2-aminoadipate transaminase